MNEKKASMMELVRADVERRLGHEMSPDGLRALEDACRITCDALAECADPRELGELMLLSGKALEAVSRGADFDEVRDVLRMGATAAERGDDPAETFERCLADLAALLPTTQEVCL